MRRTTTTHIHTHSWLSLVRWKLQRLQRWLPLIRTKRPKSRTLIRIIITFFYYFIFRGSFSDIQTHTEANMDTNRVFLYNYFPSKTFGNELVLCYITFSVVSFFMFYSKYNIKTFFVLCVYEYNPQKALILNT